MGLVQAKPRPALNTAMLMNGGGGTACDLLGDTQAIRLTVGIPVCELHYSQRSTVLFSLLSAMSRSSVSGESPSIVLSRSRSLQKFVSVTGS